MSDGKKPDGTGKTAAVPLPYADLMSELSVAPKSKPSTLLENYQRCPGAFDEFLAEEGGPRAHYAKLTSELEGLRIEEIRRRRDTCDRLVQEQGITYHVYGDPRGVERPWQLDPIPLLLAPGEWSVLEAGLIQRATLLNRILADCYGSQELIRSRWLSPALVFAQPDFLRPCHGVGVTHDSFLTFYAADLSRSPDGQWWVVSDRTQIPTGAGYALANRMVTSRILPEAFRDNHVHRLVAVQIRKHDTAQAVGLNQAKVVVHAGGAGATCDGNPADDRVCATAAKRRPGRLPAVKITRRQGCPGEIIIPRHQTTKGIGAIRRSGCRFINELPQRIYAKQ